MAYPAEEKATEIHNLGAFLRGSAIVMVGTVARMLILFITEVIAARVLLPEKYGLITWGLFLVNLLSMMTGLGLNTAIRRYVPLYAGEKDHQSLIGVIRASVFLSSMGGLVGAVLLFIGAAWLARNVMGDEREIPILLTLTLGLPLWNLQKAMLAVFGGFKLPVNKVLIEDLLMPLGFLLVVLMAWTMDWKEIPIARGYIGVYLLSVLAGAALVRTNTPYGRIRSETPKYRAGEILAFSWPLIFTEPLGKLTGVVDIVIIGALAVPYDVGTFRVASDLAATMSFILMSFGFMYLPVISGFSATGDKSAWKDMNARVARWCMLLSFPVFATLFFLPRQVIALIYGPAYTSAGSALRILALGYYGHAMVGFTGTNLAAAGFTKAQLAAHVASLTVNILANVFLIPPYGINGAAVATLLSLWTVNGICLVLMKVQLGFHPFNRRYCTSLIALLLVSLSLALSLQIGAKLSDLQTLVTFVALLTIYIGISHRIGYVTDATDRDVIKALIRNWSGKPLGLT